MFEFNGHFIEAKHCCSIGPVTELARIGGYETSMYMFTLVLTGGPIQIAVEAPKKLDDAPREPGDAYDQKYKSIAEQERKNLREFIEQSPR